MSSRGAWSLFRWPHYSDYITDLSRYLIPRLYWYQDGKRIVPVTVQVWDCLSSPLGTALVRNVSVMDP
jgi:hypothetical protein